MRPAAPVEIAAGRYKKQPGKLRTRLPAPTLHFGFVGAGFQITAALRGTTLGDFPMPSPADRIATRVFGTARPKKADVQSSYIALVLALISEGDLVPDSATPVRDVIDYIKSLGKSGATDHLAIALNSAASKEAQGQ